jgi:hypothetical protein
LKDFNHRAREIERGETVTKALLIAHQIQDQIKSTKIGSATEEEISLLREAQRYIFRFQRMMLSRSKHSLYSMIFK